MNRGKLVILLMLAAGLAAGGLKVWKQHQHMDQVLRAFSPPVVQLIAEAPRAELLQLKRLSPQSETETAETDTINIGDQPYQIVARRSLIGVKGFADVRDRLVDDRSYDWTNSPTPGPSEWHYAVQFADDTRKAHLVFHAPDESTAFIKVLNQAKAISAQPIADGLSTFFAAQFENSDTDNRRN